MSCRIGQRPGRDGISWTPRQDWEGRRGPSPVPRPFCILSEAVAHEGHGPFVVIPAKAGLPERRAFSGYDAGKIHAQGGDNGGATA